VRWGYCLDGSGSGQGQVAASCEWSNEPPCSIKCGEFPGRLRIYFHFKKRLCSMEFFNTAELAKL